MAAGVNVNMLESGKFRRDERCSLQGVGFDGSEVVQSGKKSVLKKGVRFKTEEEGDDDDEIHVTLPKTPYSGAKCKVGLQVLDTPAAMRNISSKAQMELAMLYEDEWTNDKEGVSSVKGKLDFD